MTLASQIASSRSVSGRPGMSRTVLAYEVTSPAAQDARRCRSSSDLELAIPYGQVKSVSGPRSAVKPSAATTRVQSSSSRSPLAVSRPAVADATARRYGLRGTVAVSAVDHGRAEPTEPGTHAAMILAGSSSVGPIPPPFYTNRYSAMTPCGREMRSAPVNDKRRPAPRYGRMGPTSCSWRWT